MTDTTAPIRDQHAAAAMTATVCPYLLSADRAWRASTAARDHRCTAVAPATPLTAEKQRRLCLVAEHATCATYLAAAGGAEAGGEPHVRRASLGRPASRPIARTTPMVLDHGRVSVSMPAIRGEPRLGQVLLLGLMGVAFAAILGARLSSGSGDGSIVGAGAPGPSASSSLPVTAIPSKTARPSATPGAKSPTPTRTLVPTEVGPSAKPGTSPAATATPSTYKVKRGDTLSTIATRFGTTWQVLAELNHISDPGRLRVGQVLDLP